MKMTLQQLRARFLATVEEKRRRLHDELRERGRNGEDGPFDVSIRLSDGTVLERSADTIAAAHGVVDEMIDSTLSAELPKLDLALMVPDEVASLATTSVAELIDGRGDTIAILRPFHTNTDRVSLAVPAGALEKAHRIRMLGPDGAVLSDRLTELGSAMQAMRAYGGEDLW